MTIATTTRSAYPAAVEDLIPRATDLAQRIGEIPSRNRLMKEFKVGSPKATALREALLRLDDDRKYRDDMYAYMIKRGRLPYPPTPTTDPVPGDATAGADPATDPAPVTTTAIETEQANPVGHPDTATNTDLVTTTPVHQLVTVAADTPVTAPATVAVTRPVRWWPVLLLALPAFVAIWSGWVGLGALTGFGIVHPLPGIADRFAVNSAITLPIGVETYAAYALRAWLAPGAPATARRFAKWSAIGSLILGALGQVTYHLMSAAGMTSAPWPVTILVACLPVAVLGMGAALAHLLHNPNPTA